MTKDIEYIKFNPIEIKYLASCTPLPDRPGIKQCGIWKEKLRKNVSIQEFPLQEISSPFPEIAVLHKKGLFTKISVQEYFESRASGLHNMELFDFSQNLMFKNLQKTGLPEDAVKAVLFTIDYANACSVKLARLSDATVWSYGVSYNARIDATYFGDETYDDYVFVHGKSDKGLIVIRSASKDEVKNYMQWYKQMENLQDKNPFIKLKNRLENILS